VLVQGRPLLNSPTEKNSPGRRSPRRIEELLAWLDDLAAPAVLSVADCLDVSSYRAGDDRAVLIARFREGAPRIEDPPPDLLRRPVHQWRFERRWTAAGGGS
jgi:hypothetical protein